MSNNWNLVPPVVDRASCVVFHLVLAIAVVVMDLYNLGYKVAALHNT